MREVSPPAEADKHTVINTPVHPGEILAQTSLAPRPEL